MSVIDLGARFGRRRTKLAVEAAQRESTDRMIFTDRTGLSAARNREPFLLQTYRRVMGGGQIVLLKDVSAPTLVRGRHWGAFRIGYRA